MDLQGNNRLRDLKFNGWHLFWLDLNQMSQKCLIYKDLGNGLQRNQNGVERANMSYFNHVAFISKFTWSNCLERNQNILQFYHVSGVLEQI